MAFRCSGSLSLKRRPRHGHRGRDFQFRDGALVEQALFRSVLVKLGNGLGARHFNFGALFVEIHDAAAGFPRVLQPRAQLGKTVETVGKLHDVDFGGCGGGRHGGR